MRGREVRCTCIGRADTCIAHAQRPEYAFCYGAVIGSTWLKIGIGDMARHKSGRVDSVKACVKPDDDRELDVFDARGNNGRGSEFERQPRAELAGRSAHLVNEAFEHRI